MKSLLIEKYFKFHIRQTDNNKIENNGIKLFWKREVNKVFITVKENIHFVKDNREKQNVE